MNPDGTPISAPAPVAPVAPVAATPAYKPPDGIVNDGLIQGSLHPGDINAPQPVDPNIAASAANAAAATAAATQLPVGQITPESAALTSSARSIAAAMGFQGANQFQDDRTFMEAVLAQAQAANVAQQQIAAMQNYQGALAQAQQLAAQQRQAAAAPAAKPLNAIWNPPEFNPAWQSLVRADEKGVPTLIPGAPADILPKYLAYQQYRQQFAERFLSNPEETLMPLINSAADERARAMVRQEIESRQEAHYIESFVSENSGWLHAKDSTGRTVTNPQNGKPVLSPAGQRFHQYVVAADQSGIKNVRAQEEYARAFLQRDILMAQQQAGGAAAAAQQAVIEANRRPNLAGMLPQPGTPPPPAVGTSLAQQLMLAMQAHGITDAGIDL
jgi:hypothetical protein